MKQKDITMLNIDDYIREKARSGARKIIWGRNNGLKCFYRFVNALNKTTFKQLHGIVFMGLRHYIKGNVCSKKRKKAK